MFVEDRMSSQQIADALNVSYGSVNYFLLKYKIYGKRIKNTVFKDVTLQQFKKLYRSNLTLMEIAEKLNCHYDTIMNFLRKNIIPRRINGNDNRGLKNILYQLYIVEKKSTTEIAKILNLPKSRIRTAIHQNGIKIRNKSECQQIFNTSYFSFKNDWTKMNNELLKKVRRYFTNNISKDIKKKICEDCGSKENLHIHHIKSLSLIVEEICQEHKNLKDEELFEIIIKDKKFLDKNNLKIVCRDCHYTLYHPYAGYNRQSVAKPLNNNNNLMEGSTTIESIVKSNLNEKVSRVDESSSKCKASNDKLDDDIV